MLILYNFVALEQENEFLRKYYCLTITQSHIKLHYNVQPLDIADGPWAILTFPIRSRIKEERVW